MINSICICGAGTMGIGITQVSAQSGFKTILFDVSLQAITKAKNEILKNLQALEHKGKLEAGAAEAATSRIHYTTDLRDCIADLCIEAIAEKMDAKLSLFNELAERNSESILVSNTSSLSITSIAEASPRKESIAGMHFFNPAPVMKLVEIVTTKYTDSFVVQSIVEVAQKMGKTPVICKDSPGFIVNRVARPYYIEALHIAEEKFAGYSEIDELLEATGFRMGPYRLMDLIGNDINYAVSTSVYHQLGQPLRLQPSPIQQQKVIAGELGKKTGRGYYDYADSSKA